MLALQKIFIQLSAHKTNYEVRNPPLTVLVELLITDQ